MAETKGLFTILRQACLINDIDINCATKIIEQENCSLIQAISKIKSDLSSQRIMLLLANLYGLPILDVDNYDLAQMPTEILTTAFILQYRVLPLELAGKRLKLAVVDPSNKILLAEISFKTGLALDLVLVDESKLTRLFQYNSSHYFKTIQIDENELLKISSNQPITDVGEMVNSDEDDQPIVKFVHKIIFDAVQRGASDIHFEPYEKEYRIRYRIDGILNQIASPPISLKEKIAVRIKIVAKLDISERRIPQDGRLRLALSKDLLIDIRVSTLPTPFGEKIVLRILDQNAMCLTIEALGLERDQEITLRNMITRPYGMVLVTGPTGCGKTVTLYACLNLLNDASKNISTVEDPIEIPLYGINQVAINEKMGLTFSNTLRAFLRQDPDIIMLGEIRDQDSAQIAIKAAQTGHLVLSTLHTNDASAALPRLVNMGVPVYNLGDAILIIIAQRLVRKLCLACRQQAKMTKEVLLAVGFSQAIVESGFQPYLAVGCQSCHYTGYKGRIGIFEVMPISSKLNNLILNNATISEFQMQARKEGVLSLFQHGLKKVFQGITSLTELEANINN